MTVAGKALEEVQEHWAVLAIPEEVRLRGLETARRLYLRLNVGLHLLDDDLPEEENEVRALLLGYEVAASEHLDALLPRTDEQLGRRQIGEAAAHWAFELRRALRLHPDEPEAYAFDVLQLGALAYCSDRWAEFRGWMRDRAVSPGDIRFGSSWDRRLVGTIFSTWVRLFRKSGWSDLEAVALDIAALRSMQAEHEQPYLDDARTPGDQKAKAWRLTALYHWSRATEILATYLMQGTPTDVLAELSFHYDRALSAARSSLDAPFEVLLRWLHVTSVRMVGGSLWAVAGVSQQARALVKDATERRGLFEFLPPQRVALLEQGLLDPASAAVVVDLPTSAGKTTLAEFRIIQALSQYPDRSGWVAYVAPTRALVAQLTRRLRRDLSSLGVRVEQLSAAVELDAFEQNLVAEDGDEAFDVLVATPEKLSLLIRQAAVQRPLVLMILDEAHNIEDDDRGVRIELLLAVAKRDCPEAKYLLLMPHVPNADEVARWLSPSGRSVSLGTSPWQPNDRLVGLVTSVPPASGKGRDWSLKFTPLVTTARTLSVSSGLRLGDGPALDVTYSAVKGNLGKIASAAARSFSSRGTSVVIARTIPDVWSIASTLRASLNRLSPVDEDISLVQRFLITEFGRSFDLVEHLNYGIGVHHAGLSDEARSLMEWLAETGKLRVLVATTSIAQGLNFPVSSVFLASRQVPKKNFSKEMSRRAFWNLAGRAGRVDQDSIGVIGLACRTGDEAALMRFVSDATGDLVSRLATMVTDLEERGMLSRLDQIIYADQWADFRSYVAHLYNQHSSLEEVLSQTELLLRNTFGYSKLSEDANDGGGSGQALLDATRAYASALAEHPENATLADSTGFAPESVAASILGLRAIDRLEGDDWLPGSLFAEGSSVLPQLMGVLLRVPQVRDSIEELTAGHASGGRRVAEIVSSWVNGASLEAIAKAYFVKEGGTMTTALSDACRAIYRSLAMAGTWGLSALSKMPTSGIDFANLSEDDRRQVNLVGAMLYHGVPSESAVLMRMVNVPRSVAEPLGRRYARHGGAMTMSGARTFVRDMQPPDWEAVCSKSAAMSGADYRRLWALLSGEASS